ncbi:ABC transporter permease [Bacteroides sp.]|uniref:ABC transporter permease n=1 Tax=Bacteroides sp. TaxID=29523 RepID=UPI00258E5705|nr:FtsX-like permease family protein [Bacteroides sp.]
MFRLILKTLWTRRRRNGWLLAELILVAVLSWIIFDPVIVVTYDRHLPLGYDADRLCMVSVGMLRPQAPGYDEQATDSASLMQAYLNIVERARQHPDVEQAAPVLSFAYPGSSGSSSSGLTAAGDTLRLDLMYIEFLPHTHFFETYGFRPGQGSMTPEQLSDYAYNEANVVLTEDALEGLFHTRVFNRQRCWEADEEDTLYIPLVGTVGAFKYVSNWRPIPVGFVPVLHPDILSCLDDMHVVIRLKEGVSMDRFLHDFKPWMVRQMRAGNLYARDLQSYDAINKAREFDSTTSLYRRNLSMALFFLINLCLGVIGTFWLQTRTRREEVGIMLSYGATPRRIRLQLLGEGMVLTTVATLIGCFLYLQYGLSEGLNKGNAWMQATTPCWVDHFGLHFAIVSLIIYLILLVVVLVGIYIPARRISTIPPTEALRDE